MQNTLDSQHAFRDEGRHRSPSTVLRAKRGSIMRRRELFSRRQKVGGSADAVVLDGVFGYVVHNRGEME